MQGAFFLLHLSLLTEPIGAFDDWLSRLSCELVGIQLYPIGAEGGRIHIEPIALCILFKLVALELLEAHVVGGPSGQRIVSLRIALHLSPSILIVCVFQSCDVRSAMFLRSCWSLVLKRRSVHGYFTLSEFLIRGFSDC